MTSHKSRYTERMGTHQLFMCNFQNMLYAVPQILKLDLSPIFMDLPASPRLTQHPAHDYTSRSQAQDEVTYDPGNGCCDSG